MSELRLSATAPNLRQVPRVQMSVRFTVDLRDRIAAHVAKRGIPFTHVFQEALEAWADAQDANGAAAKPRK